MNYPFGITKVDNKIYNNYLIADPEAEEAINNYVKYLEESQNGEELDFEFYVAFDYNTLKYGIGADQAEALEELLVKL